MYSCQAIDKGLYSGVKTQNVINKYKPIVKRALSTYVSNLVNQKIQEALNRTTAESEATEEPVEDKNQIITTVEELESYYTVKAILSEVVSPDKIYYKDTFTYFGILYDNKVTKWICRMYLKENSKYIVIPDVDKKEIRFDINSISDLYKLKKELILRLNNIK